jgi:hypothetical protein
MNITRPLSKYAIEHTPDHMFVHNGYTPRECSACHHEYMPNIGDVSTKRPSTFYKQCSRCRNRFNTYRKAKEERDKSSKEATEGLKALKD